MQCHSTPDGERARVCVGFALQVGWSSVPYRLAVLKGRVEPNELGTDEELHDLFGLLLVHGGQAGPDPA